MIKTCLAVLVAVALAALAAPGPRAALAHDRCPGGSPAAQYYYYYSSGDRHGGDDNCPTPQPSPTANRAMQQRQLAPAAAPSPAQPARGFPAPDSPVSPPAPGSPANTASARERAAGASVSSGAGAPAARLTASRAPEGGSPLGIGLGALAVLALVGLIVAGFRARRQIASNLDAGWPRA